MSSQLFEDDAIAYEINDEEFLDSQSDSKKLDARRRLENFREELLLRREISDYYYLD